MKWRDRFNTISEIKINKIIFNHTIELIHLHNKRVTTLLNQIWFRDLKGRHFSAACQLKIEFGVQQQAQERILRKSKFQRIILSPTLVNFQLDHYQNKLAFQQKENSELEDIVDY
ncbi:Hypothetical_protein [Hexamita inflata]|uniref:Hypothetical_protein n=1 Tax=Hexamita inflata TaxID=28002 RepID=A0AA86PAD3_9EUKA|nr:Hypothetical protein HINF_LOCUS21548 [Hexamita inflata]